MQLIGESFVKDVRMFRKGIVLQFEFFFVSYNSSLFVTIFLRKKNALSWNYYGIFFKIHTIHRLDDHVATVSFTLNHWKVQFEPLNHQPIYASIHVMCVSIIQWPVVQDHRALMIAIKMSWEATMNMHDIDHNVVVMDRAHHLDVSIYSIYWPFCLSDRMNSKTRFNHHKIGYFINTCFLSTSLLFFCLNEGHHR